MKTYIIALIFILSISQSFNQSCSNSKTYLSGGLTDSQKQKILDKHNELRNKVASGQETQGGGQPKATNMEKMKWDDTVATNAQNHANKCVFQHSQSSDRPDSGAWATYQKSNGVSDDKILSLVQLWYDEVVEFDTNHISSYQFVSSTGHYTQVVWAKSNKLGCGIVQYEGTNAEVMLVCQYSPAGNFLSQPIYEQGNQGCSNCPNNQQCDSTYSALCYDSSVNYSIVDNGGGGGGGGGGGDGDGDGNGDGDGDGNGDGDGDNDGETQSYSSVLNGMNLALLIGVIGTLII